MFYNVELLFGVPRGLVGFGEVEVINFDILEVNRSFRLLNFPLENAAFEFNFKAKSTAFYRAA